MNNIIVLMSTETISAHDLEVIYFHTVVILMFLGIALWQIAKYTQKRLKRK